MANGLMGYEQIPNGLQNPGLIGAGQVLQNVGQGLGDIQTNIQNQYMPQALSLANQAQSIRNQYMPENLSLNNQMLGRQIQYLPMSMAAKYLMGLGRYGSSLSSELGAIQTHGTQFDNTGNAVGAPQISQNIANMGSMNPFQFLSGFMPGMGGSSPGGLFSGQGQPPQGMSAQEPMLPGAAGSPPIGGQSSGNMQSMPPPQAGSSSMAQTSPGAPMAAPPEGSYQNPTNGAMTYDRMTHSFINNQTGQQIQPETQASLNYDQRGLQAIPRVQALIPDLLQGAQFQTYKAQGQEMLQSIQNKLGANKPLPALYDRYIAARNAIPESLLKVYGLNGTTDLFDRMQDFITPHEGDSSVQAANRIYEMTYMFSDFAKQAALRSGQGIDVTPSKDTPGFDPSTYNTGQVMISGYPLSTLLTKADNAGISLPDYVNEINKRKAAAGIQ